MQGGFFFIYLFFPESGGVAVWKQMLVELMEQGVFVSKCVSSLQWKHTVRLGAPAALYLLPPHRCAEVAAHTHLLHV